ncbi:MAG: methionine synthase [Deltaproteobacteria bacterium]|nr:methionine synthase [Deltaproteobacteria bacterium]
MSLTNRRNRILALTQALHERILVLDGAMGTALQAANLTAADFGGAALEGCNENFVFTRPDVIRKVHESYLEVGADIIETNSFGSTPLVLGEYGLSEKCYEINVAAAKIAREAAEKYSTPNKPRFVAGSIGPTTKAITITGGITFDELVENFYAQARGLYDGGADYFLIETCQDTRNIKAAILGIMKLHKEVEVPLPIAVSGTIENTGTMLAGQSAEALAVSLAHLDLLYIGINCATGPDFMTDHIRSLAKISKARVACVPNAGLPDSDGRYLETPQMMATVLARFAEAGWINVIGGCCGTTPAHIKAFAEIAPNYKPRTPTHTHGSFLSGIEFLEVSDEKRPMLVGERTNVIGSRKFKELICENKFDEASEIAKAQVKGGAHVIDVCLANPDRDELADMEQFLERVIKKTKAPLMIDSTDEAVIAKALTYSQGKAIINSVNLEDGEERFHKVVPLAKTFGAALVVGCIDEDKIQGMAVTRERKLEVAKRSQQLLTEKYGVAPEDIYFDPLVFPCATGDAQYVGSAAETIEGVRLIKEALPRCKTVLGISNVSFGLPPAGREVLNSVFLHHCVQSGLDLAIVNTQALVRFASISAEELKLADDLLYNRGDDPIANFANFYRGKKSAERVKPMAGLSLEERLARYIVDGIKDGLFADLDESLKTGRRPLDIINGPLMKGMDEVGRLFNNNELIVAEVLQSAEAMKAAVDHLKPHMEKSDTSSRGKVILATVKGDVHDIGKNLVDIILSNNGFEVINLGIKIPSEQLIDAVRQHRPDIVGLSGLLVKSAQQMELTADDLCRAGIDLPILVGGAALSREFTNKRIAPAYKTGAVMYAKDAMDGLDLARTIRNPELFEIFKAKLKTEQAVITAKTSAPAAPQNISTKRSATIPLLTTLPEPPDFERHLITNTPLDHIWPFINNLMLLTRHLGLKGKYVKMLDAKQFDELKTTDDGKKALEVWQALEEVKATCRENMMHPKAVFQFYRATGEGNSLLLANADNEKLAATLNFPRQAKPDGLCLADYVSPPTNGTSDTICLFAVTAGHGIRELAEQWKREGNYLKSHLIQALALETAEAYAEMLHSKIRAMWGFPDPLEMTMMERFQAKYRGKRYSFGYPACPELESQRILFDLLSPDQIGIQLTEGFMMDPEASVSAMVFHHPACTYFGVER